MTSEADRITDHQVKHLEMIQAVVARLGNGSFLIKGWTMTLSGVLLGLAANRSSWRIGLMAVVPVVGFWMLDSYYLRQERLFRALYEEARKPASAVELFSMNVSPYRAAIRWRETLTSHTMVNFYGVLVAVNLAAAGWWFFRS
jgi:hypothetical protein